MFLDGDKVKGTDPSDIDPDYRDEIVSLAKEMSKADLRDYARTGLAGLPERVGENNANSTVGSVNGMGACSFPSGQVSGSGDAAPSLMRFAEFGEYISKRVRKRKKHGPR